MPFAGAQPITGSFIPQWGTRESPRPSLQPPKPPLPRGALVWLGRDRDLLLPGVPLPHAHADLPRHGDGVHGADRAAAAEPEAPARPILPPQPPAAQRNKLQERPGQGLAGRGRAGTQGGVVPEDRPYLRARLLTSASAPPPPGTPDPPTKRSPSKCLAGKGAQRQS